MYDIFVKTHFSSGHYLRDYPGSCEHPHGHNWRVTVTVRAHELDPIGMGIDFKLLKTHVNQVMDHIDHKNLNEMEEFSAINPSSENIAQHIATLLQKKINDPAIKVTRVAAWESDSACATYIV